MPRFSNRIAFILPLVQLSGFVNSQADIPRAVAVAGEVGGVKTVRNDMQLKR